MYIFNKKKCFFQLSFGTNEQPYPNDNQSIKRNYNLRMTNLYYQVLPSGRLSFSISTMTSFHLAEASLFAFWRLYTLMCAVVQKYYEMSFIHNYSHF